MESCLATPLRHGIIVRVKVAGLTLSFAAADDASHPMGGLAAVWGETSADYHEEDSR